MQMWVPFGPLCRKWSRKETTCDRPGWVCEGDGGGFGCDREGATGGVDEVISLWSSLISSIAVSVYLGADFTIFKAT
jgi:hypothetical protein